MDLRKALIEAEKQSKENRDPVFVFPSREMDHQWWLSSNPPIPTCFGYTYFRVVGSGWQLVRMDS